MRITVADQQRLEFTFSGSTAGSTTIGGYVDLSNFRYARLVVSYRDLTIAGVPNCTITAFPAWQLDDGRGITLGTTGFSTLDLGNASEGSGLLTDRDHTTAGQGTPAAPGAVIKVEFSGVNLDELIATVAIAFVAFP